MAAPAAAAFEKKQLVNFMYINGRIQIDWSDSTRGFSTQPPPLRSLRSCKPSLTVAAGPSPQTTARPSHSRAHKAEAEPTTDTTPPRAGLGTGTVGRRSAALRGGFGPKGLQDIPVFFSSHLPGRSRHQKTRSVLGPSGAGCLG